MLSLLCFISLGFAAPFGPVFASDPVSIDLTGHDESEVVALFASTQLGTACWWDICLGLQDPRLMETYSIAPGQTVLNLMAPPWVPPQGVYLEAVFEEQYEVTVGHIDPEDLPLLVTGLASTCSTDDASADGLVEILGSSTGGTLTGYIDETIVAIGLLQPASSTTLFEYLDVVNVSTPSCADTTWVYQLNNATEVACAVDGPQEDSLVVSGLLHPLCIAW